MVNAGDYHASYLLSADAAAAEKAREIDANSLRVRYTIGLSQRGTRRAAGVRMQRWKAGLASLFALLLDINHTVFQCCHHVELQIFTIWIFGWCQLKYVAL